VFEGEITNADLRKLTDELREVLVYKFRTRKYFERESIGIKKPFSDEFIV
jgi:CRISPR-associated protein Cas2